MKRADRLKKSIIDAQTQRQIPLCLLLGNKIQTAAAGACKAMLLGRNFLRLKNGRNVMQ